MGTSHEPEAAGSSSKNGSRNLLGFRGVRVLGCRVLRV